MNWKNWLSETIPLANARIPHPKATNTHRSTTIHSINATKPKKEAFPTQKPNPANWSSTCNKLAKRDKPLANATIPHPKQRTLARQSTRSTRQNPKNRFSPPRKTPNFDENRSFNLSIQHLLNKLTT